MEFKGIASIVLAGGLLLSVNGCATMDSDAATLTTNQKEEAIDKKENYEFDNEAAQEQLLKALPRIDSIARYASIEENGEVKTFLTAILSTERDLSKADLGNLINSVLESTNGHANTLKLTLMDMNGFPIDVTQAIDLLFDELDYTIDGQSVILKFSPESIIK